SHLTSQGEGGNLALAQALPIEVDAARYQPEMSWAFQKPVTAARKANEKEALVWHKRPGTVANKRLTFTFTRGTDPGLYIVKLKPKPDDNNPNPREEVRGYVFNVDTLAEGDLKRIPDDDLKRNLADDKRDPKNLAFRTPTGWGQELEEQKNDLSESAWIF